MLFIDDYIKSYLFKCKNSKNLKEVDYLEREREKETDRQTDRQKEREGGKKRGDYNVSPSGYFLMDESLSKSIEDITLLSAFLSLSLSPFAKR